MYRGTSESTDLVRHTSRVLIKNCLDWSQDLITRKRYFVFLYGKISLFGNGKCGEFSMPKSVFSRTNFFPSMTTGPKNRRERTLDYTGVQIPPI